MSLHHMPGSLGKKPLICNIRSLDEYRWFLIRMTEKSATDLGSGTRIVNGNINIVTTNI
jgi:hypothetical protein